MQSFYVGERAFLMTIILIVLMMPFHKDRKLIFVLKNMNKATKFSSVLTENV